jgi:ATP synthase protein I
MDDKDDPTRQSGMSREVQAQEARKLRAQQRAAQSVWFGFGMSGLIGWSVAVPAVAGALLGLWIDKRYPGVHSWTLALLAAGLMIGCVNAWHWVDKENRAIRRDLEDNGE